ncbi:MAG: hypothetical protein GC168_15115 [Candidatus Hydrogenedens sp.]|nr:hypothetical protein [Candidatus Hydrogenedens sp.]
MSNGIVDGIDKILDRIPHSDGALRRHLISGTVMVALLASSWSLYDTASPKKSATTQPNAAPLTNEHPPNQTPNPEPKVADTDKQPLIDSGIINSTIFIFSSVLLLTALGALIETIGVTIIAPFSLSIIFPGNQPLRLYRFLYRRFLLLALRSLNRFSLFPGNQLNIAPMEEHIRHKISNLDTQLKTQIPELQNAKSSLGYWQILDYLSDLGKARITARQNPETVARGFLFPGGPYYDTAWKFIQLSEDNPDKKLLLFRLESRARDVLAISFSIAIYLAIAAAFAVASSLSANNKAIASEKELSQMQNPALLETAAVVLHKRGEIIDISDDQKVGGYNVSKLIALLQNADLQDIFLEPSSDDGPDADNANTIEISQMEAITSAKEHLLRKSTTLSNWIANKKKNLSTANISTSNYLDDIIADLEKRYKVASEASAAYDSQPKPERPIEPAADSSADEQEQYNTKLTTYNGNFHAYKQIEQRKIETNADLKKAIDSNSTNPTDIDSDYEKYMDKLKALKVLEVELKNATKLLEALDEGLSVNADISEQHPHLEAFAKYFKLDSNLGVGETLSAIDRSISDLNASADNKFFDVVLGPKKVAWSEIELSPKSVPPQASTDPPSVADKEAAPSPAVATPLDDLRRSKIERLSSNALKTAVSNFDYANQQKTFFYRLCFVVAVAVVGLGFLFRGLWYNVRKQTITAVEISAMPDPKS